MLPCVNGINFFDLRNDTMTILIMTLLIMTFLIMTLLIMTLLIMTLLETFINVTLHVCFLFTVVSKVICIFTSRTYDVCHLRRIVVSSNLNVAYIRWPLTG